MHISKLINVERDRLDYSLTTGPSKNFLSHIETPYGICHIGTSSYLAQSSYLVRNIINFRLLFESEVALFLNEVWGRVHSMKNWQRIPTTRLTLDGEVMVPRDNRTLAFSTELLNYIILCVTQGKSEH